MARALEQRVGETLTSISLQQRRRQPEGVEAPDEPADLTAVAGEPRPIGFCPGPAIDLEQRLPERAAESTVNQPRQPAAVWVRKHELRPMLIPPLQVPEAARRHAGDNRSALQDKPARCDTVQEGLPDVSRLLGGHTVRHHVDDQRVVRREADLFSPVVVEEMLMVEGHELADQPPAIRVGSRLDREAGCAEEFGKFVETQCDLADDAEAAAAAALQCPEQIG